MLFHAFENNHAFKVIQYSGRARHSWGLIQSQRVEGQPIDSNRRDLGSQHISLLLARVAPDQVFCLLEYPGWTDHFLLIQKSTEAQLGTVAQSGAHSNGLNN